MSRSASLSLFAELLCAALVEQVRDAGPARDLVQHVQQALQKPANSGSADLPLELPACQHLGVALQNAGRGPAALPALAAAFRALVPQLRWQRSSNAASASPAFRDGHANTQIIGPAGLERRSDLVVGASLLAPQVTYPDHSHPPREVYLVLSEGDWFNTDAGWYTPGMGGIVYHRSGITHAMRSGTQPLLALWCLWPDAAAAA